jgi:hypothetical protein
LYDVQHGFISLLPLEVPAESNAKGGSRRDKRAQPPPLDLSLLDLARRASFYFLCPEEIEAVVGYMHHKEPFPGPIAAMP